MNPVEVVKACYEAFGRGDVPGVLSHLADDVSWVDPGYPDLPYAGKCRGPAAVAEFFQKLNEQWEFTSFEPRVFLETGPDVAVFGHFSVRARSSSQAASTPWAMHWRVENGRVVSYEAYTDTAALARALRSA